MPFHPQKQQWLVFRQWRFVWWWRRWRWRRNRSGVQKEGDLDRVPGDLHHPLRQAVELAGEGGFDGRSPGGKGFRDRHFKRRSGGISSPVRPRTTAPVGCATTRQGDAQGEGGEQVQGFESVHGQLQGGQRVHG